MKKLLVLSVAGLLLASAFARAEDEKPKLGWADTAELSYVMTAGNSESSTLGFKNALFHRWDRALLTIRAEGVRAKSTDFFREAFGTPEDYVVVETTSDRLSAERYYLGGLYERKITDTFYWSAGANWERNRFSGIDNRYVASGGVGNIWLARDDMKFRTGYGLTVTSEEDLDGETSEFLGARLTSDFLWKISDNTTYVNLFIFDENLEETSDWRWDMTNAISVSMSKTLALKVSLQWLYRNEPSTVNVELQDPPGTPTGQFVPAQLEELDTIFNTSLVLNF